MSAISVQAKRYSTIILPNLREKGKWPGWQLVPQALPGQADEANVRVCFEQQIVE
jgi:hypothetical protein